jgi:trimethylamine---corrinoid protein Co-methyltransferase
LTGLLAALAGANLSYGPGMIESGMTFDYGQIVMDNEFAKMIKFAVGGIPVSDATLSVDLIREVGPFKDYLAHKNTFDHMRIYPHPNIMDRRMRDNWVGDGKLDLHVSGGCHPKSFGYPRPAPQIWWPLLSFCPVGIPLPNKKRVEGLTRLLVHSL